MISRREFIGRSLKAGVALAAAEMIYASLLSRGSRASTIVASDTFTRANANPIGGNWTTADALQPLQIVSDTAQSSSNSQNSGAYWNANVFPSSCYTQFAFGTKANGSTGRLFAGANNGLTTGYGCLVNGALGASAIGLLTFANGGTLGNNPPAFFTTINANDIVRLSVQQDVLAFLVNGVAQSIAQDFTYTNSTLSGVCGFELLPNAVTADIDVVSWAAGLEGDSRLVQSIGFGLDDGATSESGTFTNPNTLGNLLICLVGSNNDNASISVADTNLNIWQQVPVRFTSTFFGWLFYALNCKAGPNTVTATLPGAGQHIVATLAEYAIHNVTLGQSVTATNTSSAPSGTVNANAGDLLVGYIGLASNRPVLGVGGSVYRGGGPAGAGTGEIKLYDQTAVAGSNSLTGTIGSTNGPVTSAQWATIVAAFTGVTPVGGTFLGRPTRTAGPVRIY